MLFCIVINRAADENSKDGLALQYGNPENPANYTAQISKIRQHLFKMQGVVVDDSLPPAPCPGN
jgi:mannan endo-1,4-beta-mannosidase